MKKVWSSFVTLLLGSSLMYGAAAEWQPLHPANPVDQAAAKESNVSTENYSVPASDSSGLTPKRTQSTPLVQHVPVPVPIYQSAYVEPAAAAPIATVALQTPALQHEPVNSGAVDSYLYAEMERMNSAIMQLQKDTAKPDTKKAWSAPKINGRIFLDSVSIMDQNRESLDKNGDIDNAAGFRELRLGASGTGYDSFDYKVEFGFHGAGGSVVLIDNWVGVKNVPLLGYVRVGHFKPETGLYYPMGTTNVSLMEYTTSANIFGLGRRIGISSENLFANDRVRLFFGVFQNGATESNRYLQDDNQGQVVNLRLSAAPWFAQEGKRVFHVGGHWEYVSLDSKTTANRTLSAKPGTLGLLATTATSPIISSATTLTSGGVITGDSHRGGLELAYQNGRFSTRSELFAGSFDQGQHLYGTYVELAYFLTDDFRTYDLKSGAFGGVKMKRNFHPFKCGEWNLVDSFGAWQAVFQWSYTDMEDGWRTNAERGGHQNDFVAGLNWFWSPQMRWMFEYVRSNQCVGNAYSHRNQDIFATSIRYNW